MFDVYVEGATGTSLGAVRELAQAMAARYGIPVGDVHARLSRGRFRVKADVDRATAEAYLRDLEAIGARACVAPASGRAGSGARPGSSSLPPQPASRASAPMLPPQPPARPSTPLLPPQPAARPARSSLPPLLPPQPAARPARSSLPPPSQPRSTRSSLPPQPEARAASSSLPPQPEARAARSLLPPQQPQPQPQPRGAAEPWSSEPENQGLGALERSGLLALATLDDEPATASSSDGVMPASMGPAAPRTPTPRSVRNAPLDPFAPPEASAAEQMLELADVDADVARRARKRTSAPPAAEPAGAARDAASAPADAGAGRRLSLSPQLDAASSSGGLPAATALPPPGPAPSVWPGASGTAPRPSSWSGVPGLGSSRSRFVIGVLLAVVLGFVPATLIAGWRERSAYAAIDDKVTAAQAAADAPDSYAALDAFRASQLEAKRSARRTIAVTAMLIWAVVGGAVAYGWFRRMPWADDDRPG